jgi:hypothetical protein
MSDNLRQYHAIRDALRQAYPGEPKVEVRGYSANRGVTRPLPFCNCR